MSVFVGLCRSLQSMLGRLLKMAQISSLPLSNSAEFNSCECDRMWPTGKVYLLSGVGGGHTSRFSNSRWSSLVPPCRPMAVAAFVHRHWNEERTPLVSATWEAVHEIPEEAGHENR